MSERPERNPGIMSCFETLTWQILSEENLYVSLLQ